ncbi:hypothetical protein EB796_019159 [Bugula neritina]|uniref:Protein kinase domain-containing protein n=1 Tax=Bugula neritina TaxID=10212 RepID=A0A7J7J9W4_BUGNE|nr:hypothetical protein EB796_019159 [Bugula neritina]
MEDTFEDMLITVQRTSLYRAPELLHRAAPTKAADMWSMGLTTLEVMTELTPRNQSILKQVLSFEVEERESAERWLKALKEYELDK